MGIHTPEATGVGTGSVIGVSVVTANGISGSVANPGTTPAITLALADVTPSTVTDKHNVKYYGAKGDTVRMAGGSNLVSIASGEATLTVTNGSFTSADIGKAISVPGAGAAGATLNTTIIGRTSANVVTLDDNAGTTLTTVNLAGPPFLTYGTDDTAAIQAALDACVYPGGTVYFPTGWYKLTAGLTSTVARLTLLGAGGVGQSPLLGIGASTLFVADGTVGFTWGTLDNNAFGGIEMRNLHFCATSNAASTVGYNLLSGSNVIVENVVASGFSGTSSIGGQCNAGTSGLTAYNTFVNCGFNTCKTGLSLLKCHGIQVFGGVFDSVDNALTGQVSGSVGIYASTGSTLGVFGGRIQGYETGIDLAGCDVSSVMGTRFEYTKIAVQIAADMCNIDVGSVSNGGCAPGYAAAATGVKILSGSQNVVNVGNMMTAEVGTPLNDAGASTRVVGALATVSTNYVTTNDVVLATPGQYYDGPSLTLGAGTWLLVGAVTLGCSTSAVRRFDATLLEGAAVIAFAQTAAVSGSGPYSASLPFNAIVTPSASTVYKIAVASTVANDLIKATSTNRASYLLAVRLSAIAA